jgi:hypothetical protein
VYKLQQKNSREAGSERVRGGGGEGRERETHTHRHLWDAAEWDQIDSSAEVNLKAQK